jgi:DNA-binding transcriptional LysR family regulator
MALGSFMKTTLDELLAFCTVIDTGSITAAANELGQTISGVSRALSRLEKKLGTALMNRTTRRIELTEEGTAFLAQARQIIASVEDAEEQVAIRQQKPSGRLRVNAAPAFMFHVIVPLVGEFRARYPDITLELDSSEAIIDLLEHRTDVAIRIGTLQDSTLRARHLFMSRVRLLASREYLRQRGKPRNVAALSEHDLLGFNQLPGLNRWPVLDESGHPFVVEPRIAASNGETLRLLALAGQGIASLADYLTEADRERGDLVQVLAKDTVESFQSINAVYYRNTQIALRIACFLDFLGEMVVDGKRRG